MNRNNRVCLFVRVSTDSQDYQRQVNDLDEYCRQKSLVVTKVVSARVSGAKTYDDREDLKDLLASAKSREYDKVLISELSRLGRNARDVRNTIYKLHELKIPVIFYNLGGLESLDEKGQESFVSNIILSIYAELAQEERRLISERVKSGLANAKMKGKSLGRPIGKTNNTDIIKKYPKLANDIKRGLSLTECQKLHGVARNTVLKVKKIVKPIS